jgi:hypothetical protein
MAPAGFDGPSSENMGALKMDFLGQRNLTVIGDAVQNVKDNRGIDLDMLSLSLDDKRTYELPDARLALVLVCAGLVVWTDGDWYRWWMGHNWERTGRRIYAYGSAGNPRGVALWLVTRQVELESNGLLSPVLPGALP